MADKKRGLGYGSDYERQVAERLARRQERDEAESIEKRVRRYAEE